MLFRKQTRDTLQDEDMIGQLYFIVKNATAWKENDKGSLYFVGKFSERALVFVIDRRHPTSRMMKVICEHGVCFVYSMHLITREKLT